MPARIFRTVFVEVDDGAKFVRAAGICTDAIAARCGLVRVQSEEGVWYDVDPSSRCNVEFAHPTLNAGRWAAEAGEVEVKNWTLRADGVPTLKSHRIKWGNVPLEVRDERGRVIRELLLEPREPGENVPVFRGRDIEDARALCDQRLAYFREGMSAFPGRVKVKDGALTICMSIKRDHPRIMQQLHDLGMYGDLVGEERLRAVGGRIAAHFVYDDLAWFGGIQQVESGAIAAERAAELTQIRLVWQTTLTIAFDWLHSRAWRPSSEQPGTWTPP